MSRIFVLGNASLDTTLRVARLPVAGETLMADGIARSPGGKGLNQAVVAARAGAAVRFMAAIGTEPETALIRDAVAAEGLERVEWVETGAPTDLSSLMVAPDGENCIVSTGACCDSLPEGAALAFVAGMAPGDILLMQGNLRRAVTEAAARAARGRGGRVMLNTAPLRWEYAGLLPQCELVVANAFEARSITGRDGDAAALDLAGHGGGDAAGVVTMGAAGCVAASGGVARHHAAPRVVAVDSTGAGDVFCGMLAAGWAASGACLAGLGAAQAAAALAVTRPGCFGAFPSAGQARELLRSV